MWPAAGRQGRWVRTEESGRRKAAQRCTSSLCSGRGRGGAHRGLRCPLIARVSPSFAPSSTLAACSSSLRPPPLLGRGAVGAARLSGRGSFDESDECRESCVMVETKNGGAEDGGVKCGGAEGGSVVGGGSEASPSGSGDHRGGRAWARRGGSPPEGLSSPAGPAMCGGPSRSRVGAAVAPPRLVAGLTVAGLAVAGLAGGRGVLCLRAERPSMASRAAEAPARCKQSQTVAKLVLCVTSPRMPPTQL